MIPPLLILAVSAFYKRHLAACVRKQYSLRHANTVLVKIGPAALSGALLLRKNTCGMQLAL